MSNGCAPTRARLPSCDAKFTEIYLRYGKQVRQPGSARRVRAAGQRSIENSADSLTHAPASVSPSPEVQSHASAREAGVGHGRACASRRRATSADEAS
jgi:hypothetical protein